MHVHVGVSNWQEDTAVDEHYDKEIKNVVDEPSDTAPYQQLNPSTPGSVSEKSDSLENLNFTSESSPTVSKQHTIM